MAETTRANRANDPLRLTHRLIANRYRVGTLLGEGGLCVVYRGVDLKEQRDVAIKVLPSAEAEIEELAARFQREVNATKRIAHPNVATISNSGRLEEGGLYLVMELLNGELLFNLLARGRLSQKRALLIARQILLGLGEAHRIGIIHRDVKPANVMLLRLNGVEVVKLFDFGIAANERAAMPLTAAGTAFGTPEYISPEMAMGRKVDARADLYSVGVMLFEMVTGRLPFFVNDPLDYLRAHINEVPPRARDIEPELPRALDELIWRAMEKTPEARFASSDEMVAAIDKIIGPGPLAIKKRASLGTTVLVVLIMLVSALVAGWWFFGRTG